MKKVKYLLFILIGIVFLTSCHSSKERIYGINEAYVAECYTITMTNYEIESVDDEYKVVCSFSITDISTERKIIYDYTSIRFNSVNSDNITASVDKEKTNELNTGEDVFEVFKTDFKIAFTNLKLTKEETDCYIFISPAKFTIINLKDYFI